MSDFEFITTFNALSPDKQALVIKAMKELIASQSELNSRKERAR